MEQGLKGGMGRYCANCRNLLLMVKLHFPNSWGDRFAGEEFIKRAMKRKKRKIEVDIRADCSICYHGEPSRFCCHATLGSELLKSLSMGEAGSRAFIPNFYECGTFFISVNGLSSQIMKDIYDGMWKKDCILPLEDGDCCFYVERNVEKLNGKMK